MLTLRDLVYLEAEVTEEIEKLSQVCTILQKKGFFERATAERKLGDELVLRGVAGMLQDYYSGVERIFKRIAVEVDERLPKGKSWHKALLDQMKVDIPGIRPKVISSATYEKLDELRSFRPRVGNIYGFNLIPERVVHYLLSLSELDNSFKSDIRAFFEAINSVLKTRLKNARKLDSTP